MPSFRMFSIGIAGCSDENGCVQHHGRVAVFSWPRTGLSVRPKDVFACLTNTTNTISMIQAGCGT